MLKQYFSSLLFGNAYCKNKQKQMVVCLFHTVFTGYKTFSKIIVFFFYRINGQLALL